MDFHIFPNKFGREHGEHQQKIPLELRGYLGAPDFIDIKRRTEVPLAKGPLKNQGPPTSKKQRPL